MKILPEPAYRKLKGFMDRHDSIHYVFHRTVCPIVKYDENRGGERR
jgi:hypothetical protein